MKKRTARPLLRAAALTTTLVSCAGTADASDPHPTTSKSDASTAPKPDTVTLSLDIQGIAMPVPISVRRAVLILPDMLRVNERRLETTFPQNVSLFGPEWANVPFPAGTTEIAVRLEYYTADYRRYVATQRVAADAKNVVWKPELDVGYIDHDQLRIEKLVRPVYGNPKGSRYDQDTKPLPLAPAEPPAPRTREPKEPIFGTPTKPSPPEENTP